MTTNPKTISDARFVFFGTGKIAAIVLEELLSGGHTPSLIVTAPDSKQGRGLALSPTPVGLLAENLAIPMIKPASLDLEVAATLRAAHAAFFVVADYGFIIKQAILDIPPRGTLNMHPSLLPRLRGPSPIRSAILQDERDTGVTIMLVDAQMDHGPIIAQKKISIDPWPPRASLLEDRLAHEGGALLAAIIPLWFSGSVDAHEQNHDVATYTRKFEKADGLLDLSADAHENLRKIRALEGWPGTYAYFSRNGESIRTQILDAYIGNDALIIETVKPDGKNAMSYQDFLRSGAQPH
jgi:methionyl-tRNA formyltransferase